MIRPSALPLLVLAFATVCVLPVAAQAADYPASSPPIAAPLVNRNPDGSITVQKAAPKGTKTKTGLFIPPQVIVPVNPPVANRDAPENKKAEK